MSLRLIGSVLTIEHLVISGRAAAVVVIALAMTASIALVALALVPRTGGTAVFVENAGG